MWNTGHELYRSTPETFPVPFVQGDILDPAYLAPAPILPTSPTPPPDPLPILSEVKTLNELQLLHRKLLQKFIIRLSTPWGIQALKIPSFCTKQ